MLKKIGILLMFCIFYASVATALTWLFYDVLNTTTLGKHSAMEKLEDGVYDRIKKAWVVESKTFDFFGTSYPSLSAEMQGELDKIALINIDKDAYDDTKNEVKKRHLATCLNLLKQTNIEAVFIDIMFNKVSLDEDATLLTKTIEDFEKAGKKLVLPYLLQTETGHNINGDSVVNAIPIIYNNKHKGFAPLGAYNGSTTVRFFKAKIDTHEYSMYKLIRLLDPRFEKYPHLKNIDDKRKEINFITNIKEWEGHKPLPYTFHLTKKVYPSNVYYVDSLYNYAIAKEKKCDDSNSIFCRKWQDLQDKKIAIIAHLEHYQTRQMQFVNKADTPVDEHILGSMLPLNIYLNLITDSWLKKGGLHYVFIVNLFLSLIIVFFSRKQQSVLKNPMLVGLTKILGSLILFLLIAILFFYFYIKLPIIISLLLFQKGSQFFHFFSRLNKTNFSILLAK